MKIRILDRILVALAGIILVAVCAGVMAQVFFGADVIGWISGLLIAENVKRRILIGVIAALLLALGVYCLLMLFRRQGRKDKFVLQKLESGDLAISLTTVETMVKKCLDQHDEIKVEAVNLENQRDGLLIEIRGIVAGGISIPLTVDTLQRQVKQYVTACSGVEVKGVRIQVESSGEDATDAPFLIEPPVSNRLPKGDEASEEELAAAAEGETEAPAETAEEKPAEGEKAAPAEEAAAAAAAMAAAESMMDRLDIEDDRPIHQQLFSTQEEPCIMPLPPENLSSSIPEEYSAPETGTEKDESAADEKKEEPAEPAADETKGEENA